MSTLSLYETSSVTSLMPYFLLLESTIFFYRINNYCSEYVFFLLLESCYSDNYQVSVKFMAAKTTKLIVLLIIQNSEKMKFTDQSKSLTIGKL